MAYPGEPPLTEDEKEVNSRTGAIALSIAQIQAAKQGKKWEKDSDGNFRDPNTYKKGKPKPKTQPKTEPKTQPPPPPPLPRNQRKKRNLEDVLSGSLSPKALKSRARKGKAVKAQRRRSLSEQISGVAADPQGAEETGDRLPSAGRLREAYPTPTTRQEAGLRRLESNERKNAAITRIESEKARLEEIDDRTRADALRQKEEHHQQNVRNLEERGTEQDPARAREFLNRESERMGLPGLRTPEERKIAHGTYGPGDRTGLGGRMLGLVPEEAEPRRLTARERSQLAQGMADEDLMSFADETGQFDRRRAGFAAPGTVTPSGVRYEESDAIPGAVRAVGPQRARLEDLLSEADYAESVEGDTAGAAAFRGEAEGIRAELEARRRGGMEAGRLSRNARSLTQALSQRERSRPGDVGVTDDEQAMIERMTPAQRDRMTLGRAKARGRGVRDRDRRESYRDAWNAEAIRRDPSLADSLGGKPMSAFQRAQIGIQREGLRDKREDRLSNEGWRQLEMQRSIAAEKRATERGDRAEAARERTFRLKLEEMGEGRRRYEEGRDEGRDERAAREEKDQRDQQIALENDIINSDTSTPAEKRAAKERRRRLVNRQPLEDALVPDPAAPGPGPGPATPTAAEVPEGFENDNGYKAQEAALHPPSLPQGPSPQRDRHNMVLKLRDNPAEEQQMLRDLYSDKWKDEHTFGVDNTSWADWAVKQYSGRYTKKELAEFYKMEAPAGEDTDDWHTGMTSPERLRSWESSHQNHLKAKYWVPIHKAARAGLGPDTGEEWRWWVGADDRDSATGTAPTPGFFDG